MSPLHTALRRVAARSGKAGRQVALQVELAAAVGLPSAWRRRRHMALKAPPNPPWRADRYRDLWVSAAAEVGASVEELSGGFLRLTRSGRSTTVWSNLVPLDDPVTLRMAGERDVAHERLHSVGVPVPAHRTVHWTDDRSAHEFLAAHGRVVVKPAGPTGRGTGVTCGADSPQTLAQAMLRAAGWDTRVALEAQVDGEEHRLLVLDGTVIAAVRRHPPRVVGDGRSTVGALIEQENVRRSDAHGRTGLWPIRIDLDCVFTLARQGLDLSSVPAAGSLVAVKTAVNENGADDNETVRPVPPALAAVGDAAATAVGARLLSVEVITPDPGRDVAAAGGAVVEVNTTPGLLYHLQVADPDGAVNPAIPILETLLKEGEGVEAVRSGSGA